MIVLRAVVQVVVPLPPPGGPPEELVILALTIVVTGILLFPVLRAWARRLERGPAHPDLQAEVEHLRIVAERAEALEHRVTDLEDRLDFAERMLASANRGDRPELPAP